MYFLDRGENYIKFKFSIRLNYVHVIDNQIKKMPFFNFIYNALTRQTASRKYQTMTEMSARIVAIKKQNNLKIQWHKIQ